MNTSLDGVFLNWTTTNSSSYIFNPAEKIGISFAATILAVLTVVGNIFVIIAFQRNRGLRILSNYFLVSLAVTDMTIGLISIPLYTVYTLVGYWPLGAVVCDIWLCLDYTLSNVSVAHIILISFDRYLAVCKPIVYRQRRSPKKVFITIAMVWICSFLLCAPWIISWPYIEGQRTVPETECYIAFFADNPFMTIVVSLLVFYLPMLIVIALYVCIYRKTLLRKQHLANLAANGFHSSNETITCIKQVRKGCLVKCASSICCKRVVHVDDNISNEANKQGCIVEITTVSHNVMLSEAHEVIRTSAIAADIAVPIMEIQSHKNNLDNNVNTLSNVRPKNHREQIQVRKVAKVISAILIAHMVLLLPFYMLTVLNLLCSTCADDISWPAHIAWGLCYLNSTVNPFLYALCNVNFRRAFCNILTGRFQQLQ